MTHWIQDYIDLVRSGKYPVCEEQHLLIDLVEKEFASGRIYIDEEQLEKYMSYQKYFPYDLFPWESFCFALHNCTYLKDSAQLRWPMLMIYIAEVQKFIFNNERILMPAFREMAEYVMADFARRVGEEITSIEEEAA